MVLGMAMPFPPQNMQTSPYAPTPIPFSPVPLRPLPSEVRRTAQLRCFFRAVVHILQRRKASVEQPEGHSHIEFKGHYGSLLRTLGKEPDQAKQTLSDLEEELHRVRQLYQACRRSSPKAKGQIKRIQS